MSKLKELVGKGWSHWYMRAGVYSGCLGAQLLLAMAFHLAEPVSDLQLDSNLYHSIAAYHLAHEYAILGWALIFIKCVNYVVFAPALVVAFLGFSLDVIRRRPGITDGLQGSDSTAERDSTPTELKIYASISAFLWLLWLYFIQITSGAISVRQILESLNHT